MLTFAGVKPPTRYGELVSDPNGVVTSFDEKPVDTTGRISGGFFVCEPGVLDYVTSEVGCIFEQGPLQAIVKDRQAMVYEHNGFWHAMDNHRDYGLLNDLYAKGRAPWLRSTVEAVHP